MSEIAQEQQFEGAKGVCRCGHLGDGKPGEHGGDAGQSACTIEGCACSRYAWKSWTPSFEEVRQARHRAYVEKRNTARQAAIAEAQKIVAKLAAKLSKELGLPVRTEDRGLVVGTVGITCNAHYEDSEKRGEDGEYLLVPCIITDAPTSWKDTRWVPNDKGFPEGRVFKRLKDKFHQGLLKQTKTTERKRKIAAAEKVYRGLLGKFPLAAEFFELSDYDGDVRLEEIDMIPHDWLPRLMRAFHELRVEFPKPPETKKENDE